MSKVEYQRTPVVMAPTTTIETVTITRPLKVIAFICGLIVIILMIMGLASTDWLMADGWRQGLFMYCIADDAQQPLPFNVQEASGCYPSRNENYIHAAAGLCIITLITDLVATVLTGLGLRTKEHHTKYKYYRFGVIFGWAYGVGWGAAIFLFGGVVLLLCDKESEEIYYKERKIVHDNDSRA
ncbi:hypothetical protein RI129_006415 [Pyrocoelia pectoralis]|uniref:Uncharacterized protein n=1 Tax=Pyrocoelia pectoralis TaxID=417401 RepID=A0AAN7VAN7_9COLE